MFSMQSTPASLADTIVPGGIAAENEATDDTEDLWSAWPYCYAINCFEDALEHYHQFREKLCTSYYFWRLARANRRAQECFQRDYWREWNRDASDEQLELHLV
jgi:hypothetical protein